MASTSTESLNLTIEDAAASFQRHLRAANKAPRTIRGYLDAVTRFGQYVADVGMPCDVTAIRREHVESWIVAMQDAGHRPASVANRYRSLRVFMNWLVSEEEITRSPMEKMSSPTIPEIPVPLLPVEDVDRLLATCAGTTFDQRRDLALLRVLIDCGLRRTECADLRMADIDLDRNQLWVEQGKGRRSRPVAIHSRTVKAIDRYLRLRPRHPHASEDWLWLGQRGRLTDTGVLQVVRRRGRQAGIPNLHPHQLRHLSAHNDADEGMTVPDMMMKFGWRDDSMARRYGASAATERALAHSKAMTGADRY